MAAFVIKVWCLAFIVTVSLSIDLEVSYIYSTHHFESVLLGNKLLFQESISALSATMFILYIYLRNKIMLNINLFTITSLFMLLKVIFVICLNECIKIAFFMTFFVMLGSMILLKLIIMTIWPIIVDKGKLTNRLFLPLLSLIMVLTHAALWVGFHALKDEDPIVFNCILIPSLLLGSYIIKNYKETINSTLNTIQDKEEDKEVRLIQRFSTTILCFLFTANLASAASIRFFNNVQYQNYNELGTSITITSIILMIQLAVPFILKNCLPGKALTCSGVVLLLVSFCTILFESENPLLNSVLFNVSSNIFTFAAIPVKSWNLIDYEKILLTKSFAKVFAVTHLLIGMLKTLMVFNLLLTDLDLILRVFITLFIVLCTCGLIFMMKFDKMIHKVVQVSSITLA